MDPSEVFTYDSYEVNPSRELVLFHYHVNHDGETFAFTEELRLPYALYESYETASLLRALHIALGVSYYKLFVPATISHSYAMDQAESDFWNTIWRHGLGEFLYVNHLGPERLAKFVPQDGTEMVGDRTTDWQDRALLGIGGGKDSIVAGELLKDIGIQLDGFVLATGPQLGQSQDVAKTMDIALHAVERRIDPLLLELNKRNDAYNGHVPISVIFALIGSLLAVSKQSKYVIVANEASASIPQVTDEAGAPVNHQWSKSFQFELLFQQYLHITVSPELDYFSAVRPLNSVAMAKLFAQLPQYLTVFTSDNTVFRVNSEDRPNGRWSLQSPKSLSSFILLSPWFDENSLIDAFGMNFMDQLELKDLFLELLGAQGQPPLDCVGTVDELVASLSAALQQGKFANASLTVVAQEHGLASPDILSVESFLALETEQAFPPSIKLPLLTCIQERIDV